ncbi:MAG: type II toxin-antitoxin system PemK/MazF family toxin, partial [Chloroflexi bacterium]|nr:type II toxin-antitoxin system PemK/MazF family toxin [Chloroflexota bacterium]
GKQGKAMADQLATVSKQRLFKTIGRVSEAEIQEIEKAIRIQLGL